MIEILVVSVVCLFVCLFGKIKYFTYWGFIGLHEFFLMIQFRIIRFRVSAENAESQNQNVFCSNSKCVSIYWKPAFLTFLLNATHLQSIQLTLNDISECQHLPLGKSLHRLTDQSCSKNSFHWRLSCNN